MASNPHIDTALSSERPALVAVVAELQRAQQHENVDDFVALFGDDATWVTGAGRRLIGRAEIAEFTGAVLPGAMSESTATYQVEHIVLVRPDVAVVSVRQQPVSLDGQPLDGVPEGRPTYVMAREPGGAWKIVAGQNTQVRS